MALHIVQQQLVQAVVALLQASPPVAEVVQEERDDGAGYTQASVINVSVPVSTPDGMTLSGSVVMWSSTLQLDIVARAATGATARAAVSPIVAAAYARIMNDTTLGAAGWSLDGPPTLDMGSTVAEDRLGGCRLIWHVLHRSTWTDLTTPT